MSFENFWFPSPHCRGFWADGPWGMGPFATLAGFHPLIVGASGLTRTERPFGRPSPCKFPSPHCRGFWAVSSRRPPTSARHFYVKDRRSPSPPSPPGGEHGPGGRGRELEGGAGKCR